MNKNEIIFNKVFILQSLLPNERKTGDEIFNVIKLESFKNNSIQAELFDFASKNELIKLFNDIKNEVKNNIVPLIHFEMHGSKDGIGTQNGELILWDDIAGYLRQINVLVNNNLFVSLATCYGAYLLFSCDPEKPSPSYGYLGPTDKIGNMELEADFTLFFQVLFTKLNFKFAIEAISTINTSVNKYKYINCFELFEMLLINFNKEQENPRLKNLRVKNIVNKYSLNNPNESKNSIKKRVQYYIEMEQKGFLENMKKTFTHSN